MALSVLCSATSGYLTWLSEESLARMCLVAGVSMAITWQWRGLGAAVSLSAVSLVSYWRHRRTNTGRLVFLDSSKASGLVGHNLAHQIEKIIKRCPELTMPRYIPTFWAADQWANIALFVAKQVFDKSCLRSNRFTREIIKLADGGTVSIDFADDDQLPHDSPFVIFLHTITGSAYETGHYMRYATRRGWKSCVFNRRGHAGVSLTSPSFNVMGDASDTKAQVDFVKEKYPTSYLAMVGISAGSGLLFTYMGKMGGDTPVRTAAALCPAYDIRRAFRLAENYPMADRHIVESMKRLFIDQNTQILCSKSQETYEACSDASTVHDFVRSHYPFAGFETLEEYYENCNPMEWVGKIMRPVLIVNSEDDIVCLAENIREDIVRSHPGALLLRTKKGSHISFNEGIFGTGCYLSRITMDFLDTARILDLTEPG